MLLICFGSEKRAFPNVVQQFRVDHLHKRRMFGSRQSPLKLYCAKTYHLMYDLQDRTIRCP